MRDILFFWIVVQCDLKKSLNKNTFLLYIYLYNCRCVCACTTVETSFWLGSMSTSVKPCQSSVSLFKDWKKYNCIRTILCLSYLPPTENYLQFTSLCPKIIPVWCRIWCVAVPRSLRARLNSSYRYCSEPRRCIRKLLTVKSCLLSGCQGEWTVLPLCSCLRKCLFSVDMSSPCCILHCHSSTSYTSCHWWSLFYVHLLKTN